MKKIFKCYVWKKEYNVIFVDYGSYSYKIPLWTDLYRNFTNDISKYFVRDKDLHKDLYYFECAEKHDESCKLLIFKIPRKEYKTFLMHWTLFKASIDEYFFFKEK